MRMLSLNSNSDIAIKPNFISDYLTSAMRKELGVKSLWEKKFREKMEENREDSKNVKRIMKQERAEMVMNNTAFFLK